MHVNITDGLLTYIKYTMQHRTVLITFPHHPDNHRSSDKYWTVGSPIYTTATMTKPLLTHHSSQCTSAPSMLLEPSIWEAIGPVYNTNKQHCFPTAFNSILHTKNATCKTSAYYCKLYDSKLTIQPFCTVKMSILSMTKQHSQVVTTTP